MFRVYQTRTFVGTSSITRQYNSGAARLVLQNTINPKNSWPESADHAGATTPSSQYRPSEPHQSHARDMSRTTREEARGKYAQNFIGYERKPIQRRTEASEGGGSRRIPREGYRPQQDARNLAHQRTSMSDTSEFGRGPRHPPPWRTEHESSRHPTHDYARNAPLQSRIRHSRGAQRSSIVPAVPAGRVNAFFEEHVYEWANRPHVLQRLISYGLPRNDARILLKRFVKDVQAGVLSRDAAYYNLERLSQIHDATSIDVIYSTVFFSWAPRTKDVPGVHPNTVKFLERLLVATSRAFPADEWPAARALHRKIIMHVGPTNSGKTHHALRALASAKSGVYAGPLRLLAHEIYLRMNRGQIVPLGVDEEVVADKSGNPKYARLCNMVTGEEKKIVDEDAPLLSCTVEMLSFQKSYDVAVIDEIQMIADVERGNGWTQAVLGIQAQEIHLCGEETAVPLVRALLADTGDTIEVRRYERLTPLTVDKNCLEGDLSKIQKGDCIVTFSRSSIFALKKSVEAQTGMRCAVVYGRLPPEIRSEQAALFNDPDSGYDVLIGSDAIGMGLNLKIKRVIFAATSKFNGKEEVPLPVSSVKQIAGRAGRYGLHEEQSELGGSTTTMFPADLPHLIRCLATPFSALPYARIGYNAELISSVLSVLPPGTTMSVILSAPQYIGRLPSYLRYVNQENLHIPCAFLDNEWRYMTNVDKVTLLYSPIPWRDERTVDILKKLLIQQAANDSVKFGEGIKGTGLLETMEAQEELMHITEAGGQVPSQGTFLQTQTLMQMESFHKVLVLYVWMAYRNTVIYPDGEEIVAMKERLERVLNWMLGRMSMEMNKKTARDLRKAILGEERPKTPESAKIDDAEMPLVSTEESIEDEALPLLPTSLLEDSSVSTGPPLTRNTSPAL